MAASTFSDDDEGVISDINITPLVDVVLVLLIVFLITVPAIVASAPIKVDLPKSTSVKLADEMPAWIVSVRRVESGELAVYLNERQIDEAQLVSIIREQDIQPSQQSVTLAADQAIPYGEVIKVLDMLHRVGLQKVAVDTKHVE